MTLATFVDHVAASLRYNTDAGLGTVNTTDLWKKYVVYDTNRALSLWWQPGDVSFILPHAAASDDVDVTDGVIDFADVDTTYLLTAWASDPRGQETLPTRYKVTREYDGWRVGGSPGSSVYAFWSTAVPVFTEDDLDDPDKVIPDALVPMLVPAVLSFNAQARPSTLNDRLPNYLQQTLAALTDYTAKLKPQDWYVPDLWL